MSSPHTDVEQDAFHTSLLGLRGCTVLLSRIALRWPLQRVCRADLSLALCSGHGETAAVLSKSSQLLPVAIRIQWAVAQH